MYGIEDVKNTDEKLEKVIEEIDTMMERLEMDEEHQPLRLLGVKTSFELMNEIYATLITIALAVAQKLISGMTPQA